MNWKIKSVTLDLTSVGAVIVMLIAPVVVLT